MINRLGYDHDNYFPDYAKAISAARGTYVAQSTTSTTAIMMLRVCAKIRLLLMA